MATKQTAEEGTIVRVPLHTVILSRGGKRVIPLIDKPFPFTQKEIDDIESVNKGALRAPNHEGKEEVAEPADADRMAVENNREPARDTRTPAQKKKDEENAKKEANKPKPAAKTTAAKPAADAADKDAEI